MNAPDVLIAGGGGIGLVTAYRLACEGARAVVVDEGRAAATAAAAGMLAPSFERTLAGAEALAAFSRASLDGWRALAPAIEEDSGVGVDLQLLGILSVAFEDEGAGDFPADLRGGVRLTGAEARALEPALGAGVACAWFAESDGQVDPRALLRALPEAIARRGGRILRGQRVAAVEQSGGAVSGVRLASGERIGAGAVIVATGARLGDLGGLPEGAVFPVKGEALALERPAAGPARVIRTRSAYLCPKADGRIIIGATEIARDASLTTDDARLSRLKAGALRAAPALGPTAERERWAGLRPATADALPVIGATASDPAGLVYALGHYRNGVLLAPATADAILRLLLRCEAAPAAFSPARFIPSVTR
ncbi:MAG: FAD-dependent oxidoreductase [Parvularculaceae bacterium]